MTSAVEWSRVALAKIRDYTRRGRLESEQAEEIAFHLEMEIDRNRSAGMSDADARREALRAFGGVQRAREESREARGIALLDGVLQDARFALRRLRRAPAFAAGSIITLGVGVGTAVGIGSLVHTVVLRPLPYESSDALVRVSLLTPGLGIAADLHSEASFAHLRDAARSLDVGAYYTNDAINVTDGDEAERVTASMVTPNVFPMLGVAPALGRLFTDPDTAAGQVIPVLISHQLWMRRYGGDSAILQKGMEINRSARRVVGVLPASFDFPSPRVSVWYPLTLRVEEQSIASRYLDVVGRLRSRVTIEESNAEANAILRRLPERFPRITSAVLESSGARIVVRPLRDAMIAPVRSQLVLLGTMVGVVLLITMANVTNLFLVRSERLRPEIAVVAAMGAGRGVIARRFLVEGAVVGLLSSVIGIAIAGLGLGTRFGFSVRDIPRLHEVSFGGTAIVATAAVVLVAGTLAGLISLVRAISSNLADGVRAATRATTGGWWQRVQAGLVALQIAMALTLVLSSGLMGRSLLNLRRADLGFAPGRATTFEVALPYSGYGRYPEAAAFHTKVVDRLRALPGAVAAEAAMGLPLTGGMSSGSDLRLIADHGRAAVATDGEQRAVSVVGNLVTGGYFAAMGIRLRSGRTFAPGDLRAPSPAVVLSATLARQLFGVRDPIGQEVRSPRASRGPFRVVGVVGDVPGGRIEDGASPLVYFPLLRDGDGVPADSTRIPFVPRWIRYVVRLDATAPDPGPSIRSITRELDRRVPVVGLQSMDALVDAATARVRLTMLLLATAASAAVLLGVVGVYSVVSYAVAGRRREMGIRLALGATPGTIRFQILRDGALLGVAGIAVGALGALIGSRVLQSLLYEVSATDMAVYGVACAIMLGVTVIATLLPARRAAAIDPALVMRAE